jgi:hypothetical protein
MPRALGMLRTRILIGRRRGAQSDPVERLVRTVRQFHGDDIAGSGAAAGNDHAHDPGLAHEGTIRGTVQNGLQQARHELIDLGTRVAQTGHLHHSVRSEPKLRTPGQGEQVDASGRNILAQLTRSDLEALLPQLVEQLRLDQVDLAKVGLRWVCRHTGTVLHRDTGVRVTGDPDSRQQPDLVHDGLAEAMLMIRAHGDDGRQHGVILSSETPDDRVLRPRRLPALGGAARTFPRPGAYRAHPVENLIAVADFYAGINLLSQESDQRNQAACHGLRLDARRRSLTAPAANLQAEQLRNEGCSSDSALENDVQIVFADSMASAVVPSVIAALTAQRPQRGSGRPRNAMPLSGPWGYRSDKARHDVHVLQIRPRRVRRRVILGRRRGRCRGERSVSRPHRLSDITWVAEI